MYQVPKKVNESVKPSNGAGGGLFIQGGPCQKTTCVVHVLKFGGLNSWRMDEWMDE